MKETTGADFKSATDSENKKLFIETYGCQMNVADSEVIASIMQMAGYHVCETLDEADAVFMNTCSIRDNAEQKDSEPSGVFPFYEEKQTSESDCRCVGLHGRTCKR